MRSDLKWFGTFTLACVIVAIAAQSATAAITEYYSRAEWEAALGVVVVEDINTLENDIAFSTAGDNTSFGTHTFTSVNSPTGGYRGVTFTTNGGNPRNIDGTPFLTWSGTTGSEPWVEITVPESFGVGVDYNVQSESNDSDNRPHNSFYFDVTGNSGQVDGGGNHGFGKLVNDTDQFGVGNVPLTGFFGVIDDQGGITSYGVGSVWTNFQSFGVVNFSYGTPVPEPSSILLATIGLWGLAFNLRRRRRRT